MSDVPNIYGAANTTNEAVTSEPVESLVERVREGLNDEIGRAPRAAWDALTELAERVKAAERLYHNQTKDLLAMQREVERVGIARTFAAQEAVKAAEARAEAAERERDELVEALERAVTIATGLFQMVSDETWRDSCGDDGQGLYEGEHRAAVIRDELAALAKVRSE